MLLSPFPPLRHLHFPSGFSFSHVTSASFAPLPPCASTCRGRYLLGRGYRGWSRPGFRRAAMGSEKGKCDMAGRTTPDSLRQLQ